MNSLANSKDSQVQTAASIPVLTFCIDGQICGLLITAVRQLIEMVAIIKLPEAPPTIQGVINVHGQIVPVMDLRLRLGLPFLPYHLHTPIILLERNGRTLALVVDHVESVIEVKPIDIRAGDEIMYSPTNELPAQTDCFYSMAKVNDQIILLFNADFLLNTTQEIQLPPLLAQAEPEFNLETVGTAELAGV